MASCPSYLLDAGLSELSTGVTWNPSLALGAPLLHPRTPALRAATACVVVSAGFLSAPTPLPVAAHNDNSEPWTFQPSLKETCPRYPTRSARNSEAGLTPVTKR